MKNKSIKVFIKKPRQNAYLSYEENTLKAFQERVGGYIEAVTLAEDLCIICNEEGRIKQLEHNCNIAGLDFYGTIMFVGVDGDEFTHVPMSYTEFKTVFPQLLEVEK